MCSQGDAYSVSAFATAESSTVFADGDMDTGDGFSETLTDRTDALDTVETENEISGVEADEGVEGAVLYVEAMVPAREVKYSTKNFRHALPFGMKWPV